jgi:hypothetical protein
MLEGRRHLFKKENRALSREVGVLARDHLVSAAASFTRLMVGCDFHPTRYA